jgi:hypothetical protein
MLSQSVDYSSSLTKGYAVAGEHGTTTSFEYVQGTVTDWMRFPQQLSTGPSASWSDHTIVYVARYSSSDTTKRKRIVSGTTYNGNAAIGFHNGQPGVTYFVGDWLTPVDDALNYNYADDWFLIVSSRMEVRANGRPMGIYTAPYTGEVQFGINYGDFGVGSVSPETSDFQIADYLFFNRNLDSNEISAVEQAMSTLYGIPLASVLPSPSPTPTPTPTPSDTNTPTPTPSPTPSDTSIPTPTPSPTDTCSPTDPSAPSPNFAGVSGVTARYEPAHLNLVQGTWDESYHGSCPAIIQLNRAAGQFSGLTIGTNSAGSHGSTQTFSYVEGTSNDWVVFPQVIRGDLSTSAMDHTVVYLARYASSNPAKQQRIISGITADGNAAIGFHGTRPGVSYLVGGWLDPVDDALNYNDVQDWFLIVASRWTVRANGRTMGNASNTYNQILQFGINYGDFGIGSMADETSDFQIADYILFDHNLNSSEIAAVEQSLAARYGIALPGSAPTPSPTPTPTPSVSNSPTPTPSATSTPVTRTAQTVVAISSSVKKGKTLSLPAKTKQGQLISYTTNSNCKIAKVYTSKTMRVSGRVQVVKTLTSWKLTGAKRKKTCQLTLKSPATNRYLPLILNKSIVVK